MRFTTIFHFLNFKQIFSLIIIKQVDTIYIVVKNKFTILSLMHLAQLESHHVLLESIENYLQHAFL